MALLHVRADAGLDLLGAPSRRNTVRKHGLVDFQRAGAARTANHDLVPLCVPLDHRARPDPQPPPNLGRDGDLALSGQPRLGDLEISPAHGWSITTVIWTVNP